MSRIRLTEILDRDPTMTLFGGVRESDGQHVSLHVSGGGQASIENEIRTQGFAYLDVDQEPTDGR